MIDTKLINKARHKSEVIQAIDTSWRSFVDELRENIFRVPFKGSYQALVEDDSFFVEGYSGLLWVDKLYYQNKTYLLNEPVKYYPFKIYGVYDQRGNFEHFSSRPEMGFHYLGLTQKGHAICTGEIQYSNPESLLSLQEAARKIVGAFRLVNLESLGTVLLPDEYASLRDILQNKEEDIKIRFKKLLKEKLIEEII